MPRSYMLEWRQESDACVSSTPDTAAAREQRDRLLTRAMRPDGAPFAIHTEYPLVLSPAGTSTSYCLGDSDSILAHANPVARVLVQRDTGERFVSASSATSPPTPNHRGQGLERRLLDELKTKARELDLEALILWSDLLEFYQKQGFSSYGRELRFVYQVTQAGLRGGTGSCASWGASMKAR